MDKIFETKLETFEKYELLLRRELDFVPVIASHVLEGYKLIEELSGATFSDILYVYDGSFAYSLRVCGEAEKFNSKLKKYVFDNYNKVLNLISEAISSMQLLEFATENGDIRESEKFFQIHKDFTKYYIFFWMAGVSLGKGLSLFESSDLKKVEKIRNSDLFTSSLNRFFPDKDKSVLSLLFPSEIINFYNSSKFSKGSEIVISLKNNELKYSRNEELVKRYINKIDLLHKGKVVSNNLKEIKGTVAFVGKVTGRVRMVMLKKELDKVAEGDILVTEMTTPEYVPALKKCSAIVTDEGGMLCHAAIVSRELNKPCIIGTKIATKILKDGDEVEVDAEKGVVRIIKKADE